MQKPNPPERVGCRDVLVLERALFSIIVPIFAAMLAVFLTVAGSLYLLLLFPPLTILPFVGLGIAVWLFSRWERWHFRPPWVRAPSEGKAGGRSGKDLFDDVFHP